MPTYELVLPVPAKIDGDFPYLSRAIIAISSRAEELWLAYAMGEELPDGRRVPTYLRSDYARSITNEEVGPYAREISSKAKYASHIERGFPARDQKIVLDSSHRARIVKSGPHVGMKYLIVPFRHGTPGTLASPMPVGIYRAAKGMRASFVTGYRDELSVQDQSTPVRRMTYSWGARLSPRTAEQIAPKLKPSHTTSIYSGMVRFDRPVVGGHSHYVTFRTMGAWSNGWIIPPRDGLYPLRNVRDQIQDTAERIIAAAIERDLSRHAEALVKGALG